MTHEREHAQFHLPEDFDNLPPAGQAFARFFQAMQAHRLLMMRTMSGEGTHPGQSALIREIAHNEGLTQAELAQRAGVARPTVTVMLQKMEQAGLIERRPDKDDQRYIRIYMTEAGAQKHAQVHERLAHVVSETIGPMTQSDQKEFARLLEIYVKNATAAIDRLPRPNEDATETSEGERA